MMFNTTRDAPFGTDDTPQFRMKIIGGKQIEVLGKKTAERVLSQSVYREPRAGPHGTPPILTQPQWSAYDRRSGMAISQPHVHSRRQGTFTQPFGDRSFSFQHGKKVLPPINVATMRTQEHSQDNGSLDHQVAVLLRNYDSDKLKSMYNDLVSHDTDLSGLASDTLISLTALRNQLPISRSIMQLVMAKYMDSHKPDLINYEQMLKFLSKCKKMHSHHDETMSQQNQENDVKHGRSKTSPAVLMLNSAKVAKQRTPDVENIKVDVKNINGGSNHNEPVTPPIYRDDKLVHLVVSILSVDDDDITNLRDTLKELDRTGSGELPSHVIRSNLIKYRISLTSSLIDKLLRYSETKNAMVDWRLFMDPIIAAQNMQHRKKNAKTIEIPKSPKRPKSPTHDHHVEEKRTFDGKEKTKVVTAPWERLPLKSIGHQSNTRNSNAVSIHSFRSVDSVGSMSLHLADDEDNESQSTMSAASSRIQLPQGWDEHEHLNDFKPGEPWMNKFNKLTHALRTYMPGQPDILPFDVALRVTKNYNLIYGLGFSEKKIEAALRQTVVQKSDKIPEDLVPVQELLDVLSGQKRLIL